MKDSALWSYLVSNFVIHFRLLLIAPLSRVLFWKLIVTWLVKISTAIYGTLRDIRVSQKPAGTLYSILEGVVSPLPKPNLRPPIVSCS